MTARRIPDDPAQLEPEPDLLIRVDGEPIAVRAGETVAGALLAAGRLSWRTTRGGRPRGLFCGIGVCFDCLVTINGLTGVRACLQPAADGDQISTIDGGLPAPASPDSRTGAIGGDR